ncbi:MAG TPA: RelA/SpoT family protein [Cytophagales bacterium]|jgi:guanosine-3',5'-bis(diphosphate) 3'-pyrophosphohydrolase|nr:RelA/SpoT family protein [Cytophagales bacterium]
MIQVDEIDTIEENKNIVSQYRKLLRHAKPILKEGDSALIRKAFNMAMDAHKGMRRKSGEPYILHPIAVAQIAVEEIGLGTTSIIASLLHDVVEDTEIEIEDIRREFGPKVAKIIDGLTKISGVFDKTMSQQAENFRKMLLTLSDDLRVILIKLADRLHNMRTLDSMARDKQLKIASETIYLYSPLAHRLGLYAIKTELEDLYLKYSDPATYREIANKLAQNKAARNRFIREFIAPLELELNKQKINYVIKGRPKSIFSIWNKMRQNNVDFEHIYDLFAIRIIVDTELENEKAVCWQVYSIVTDYYKPNPDRLRDWISTPRSNGYESLHSTVMSKTGQWVEVQIRTVRMDEIAEKGYAAHWKYKENIEKDSKGERGLELWINKVRDLLQRNDLSAVDFVDEFKSNLFTDEVFAFSPKGDLKVLPAGSTALDFAFEIHTQIGAHCLGAKVNQKLVPLSYVLNNGDQIEIITSSKQRPTEDWLKFVVTTKAKSKIKDWLKDDKKRIADDGKEIVQRKLKHLKLVMTQELLSKLLAYFRLKNSLDLYYKVAKEIIDTKDLKAAIEADNITFSEHKKDPVLELKNKEIKITTDHIKQEMLLIGEGLDKIDYTLAKCCNPIPGDQVFGFVTVNEGIKIHQTTCPNAAELMSNYGYRIVKAKWTESYELAFLAGLRVKGSDRVGILNNITRVISNELKVNIRSLTIDTEDGIFEGTVMLFVHDTKQLDKLIRKLQMVPGVVSVNRFYT